MSGALRSSTDECAPPASCHRGRDAAPVPVSELEESLRSELARELHDSLGQTVTAIRAIAAFLERHADTLRPETMRECAAEIQMSAGEMAEQIRGLLRDLMPADLNGAQVGPCLASLIERWQRRLPDTVFETELAARLPPLASEAALALFRTLQEGLTNIARHSRAKRVRIRLWPSSSDRDTGVCLELDDDGLGQATEIGQRMGNGLRGMGERAAIAGGRLALEDSPLGGLGIRLLLPSHRERR